MIEIATLKIMGPKISISKWLSQKFGGKWKYDGEGHWFCDDGERYVAKVCFISVGEYEESLSPPSYILYSPNGSERLNIGE